MVSPDFRCYELKQLRTWGGGGGKCIFFNVSRTSVWTESTEITLKRVIFITLKNSHQSDEPGLNIYADVSFQI